MTNSKYNLGTEEKAFFFISDNLEIDHYKPYTAHLTIIDLLL